MNEADQVADDLSHYGDVHLPHYLLRSGLYEHLLFLLNDVDFQAAKVGAVGANELLVDLRIARDEVPTEFDSRVDESTLRSLRQRLTHNVRLFAREGPKFSGDGGKVTREKFDRQYVYGLQRWKLDKLEPYAREWFEETRKSTWALHWISDREAHALEESRVFHGAKHFLLVNSGTHLLVARDESIDVYDISTWRMVDSILSVGSTFLEKLGGGNLILVANKEAVEIWNTETFEREHMIETTAANGMVKMKVIGDRWAFAGGDTTITRIDLRDTKLREWSTESRIAAWCPHPNGGGVFVGDFEGVLRLLDNDATDQATVVGNHDDIITEIAVTLDANTVISGSQDGQIRRWDLRSRMRCEEVATTQFGIQQLSISGDGRYLVATTHPYGKYAHFTPNHEDSEPGWATIIPGTQKEMPSEALVWDLSDWRFLGDLAEVSSEIGEVSFSPSSHWLAIGYVNGSIDVWDLRNHVVVNGPQSVSQQTDKGDLRRRIRSGVVATNAILLAGLIGLAIAQASSFWRGLGFVLLGMILTPAISFGYGYLSSRFVRRQTTSGDMEAALAGEFRRTIPMLVALVVLVGIGSIWVNLWFTILSLAAAPAVAGFLASLFPAKPIEPEPAPDRSGSTPRWFGGHGSAVSWLGYAPNERSLFSASSSDQTLKMWRIDSAESAKASSRQIHDGAVDFILPIPGTSVVASAGEDGRLGYWNVDGGEGLGSAKGHDREISSLSVAPGGELVATASKDEKVILWWLNGQAKVFSRHDVIVADVKVLSDDRVASVDVDGNLLLWRPQDGEVLLSHHFSGQQDQVHVTDLAISPDQSFLIGLPASGFNFYKVLGVTLNMDYPATPVIDLESGAERARLPHASGARFLTDTEVLLFVSNRVHRWNLATGESIVLAAHEADIVDVVVTSEGGSAVLATEDGTLQSWNLRQNLPRDTSRISGKPTVMTISKSSSIVAIGTASGEIRAVRTLDLTETATLSIDSEPRCLQFVQSEKSAAGEVLMVGDDSGRVYCFELFIPS